MKRLRSLGGPFEEQFFFEPDEIDEMCLDSLRLAGYLPASPQPVNIERFIEANFRCLVGYDNLPVGVLGCTQFNENGTIKAVTISDKIDDGSDVGRRRERSTWAHEGGHCLMHPALFLSSMEQVKMKFKSSQSESAVFQGNRILCRDADIRPGEGKRQGYDGRWWEWQANRAIGAFLLPKDLVKITVAPFLQDSIVTKSPSMPSAQRGQAEQEVAKVFDVNPVVARIRLQEMFPAQNSAQLEF
jgi:hypothetical protein